MPSQGSRRRELSEADRAEQQATVAMNLSKYGASYTASVEAQYWHFHVRDPLKHYSRICLRDDQHPYSVIDAAKRAGMINDGKGPYWCRNVWPPILPDSENYYTAATPGPFPPFRREEDIAEERFGTRTGSTG